MPRRFQSAEGNTPDASRDGVSAPALLAEAAGQSVVMDYTATGLTLHQHPLVLLRLTLTKLGYHDTRRLNTARRGTSIRLPGIVLMRQRPGTANGVVFVTFEDEFGIANLVVFTNVGERDRSALIGSRLMLAEGTTPIPTRSASRGLRNRTLPAPFS
jgi:error-prone DNA polymerase